MIGTATVPVANNRSLHLDFRRWFRRRKRVCHRARGRRVWSENYRAARAATAGTSTSFTDTTVMRWSAMPIRCATDDAEVFESRAGCVSATATGQCTRLSPFSHGCWRSQYRIAATVELDSRHFLRPLTPTEVLHAPGRPPRFVPSALNPTALRVAGPTPISTPTTFRTARLLATVRAEDGALATRRECGGNEESNEASWSPATPYAAGTQAAPWHLTMGAATAPLMADVVNPFGARVRRSSRRLTHRAPTTPGGGWAPTGTCPSLATSDAPRRYGETKTLASDLTQFNRQPEM